MRLLLLTAGLVALTVACTNEYEKFRFPRSHGSDAAAVEGGGGDAGADGDAR